MTDATATDSEQEHIPEKQSPFYVEIVGELHRAEFPALCIKCGAPAEGTLAVNKLFRRTSTEHPSYYVLGTVNAPCCASCRRIHESQYQPIAHDVKKKLLLSWFFKVLPYLFPLAVNVWFVGIMLSNLFDALVDGGDWWRPVIWAGLSGFFILLAAMFYRMIRDKGGMLIIDPPGAARAHHVKVEHGFWRSHFIVPTEPTSIERAINFTDDISQAFDSERHLFTFENQMVGGQFAERNAGNQWNPEAPRARFTGKLRWAVLIGIVLFGLYAIIRDFIP